MRRVSQRFALEELAIVRDYMRQAKEVFQRQMRGIGDDWAGTATSPRTQRDDGAARRRQHEPPEGNAAGKVGWRSSSQVGTGMTTACRTRHAARPVQGKEARCRTSSTSTTRIPVRPMELKDLLGGKGANLAEMTSVLELPVPPGFTISTDACRAYMAGGWPKGLDAEVAAARAPARDGHGQGHRRRRRPALVSVRSGAKFSMPGMMDTVLNLGLNDDSVEGLAKQTGDERFAFDSYRRFIAMYARIVLELPGEEFDSLFDAAKELAGTESDAKVPVELLRYLVDSYQQIVERHTGKPFPQKPAEQLRGAIEAVFRSWNGPRAIAYRERERIAHDLGTAVNVQAMVFGNRDDNSGTGVGFTRDPATGAKGAYGDFLVNAQGEDVVAGIRNTEPIAALKKQFPKVHAELLKIFARLESHYKDMCDTEFTIEQGKLWMLQTRVGKRTGAAALKMAVDMVRPSDLGISKAEAVSRITEDHLDSVLHPQFAGSGYADVGQGPRREPGRRGRPHLLHRRRRGRGGRARRAGGPGPQRDLARGRARHARRPRAS